MAHLSKAELANLQRTFEQFDANKSKTIDLSELEKVMEHIGVCMNKEQLQELVDQVDVNKNGELEFSEFTQLITMWKDASKFKLFDNTKVKSLSKTRIESVLKTKLLLSDSWWRCAFDSLVALVATGYCMLILYDDAVRSMHRVVALEIAVTVLFAIDLFVCAFTCFVDGITFVETPKETVIHYLRRWFVPDLLSAMPWDLILGGLAGMLVRHLRLLKVVKITHLWEQSGRMPINAHYITFHFKVLPVTLLLLLFVLMVHAFAVGFMLLKQYNGSDPLLEDGDYPYFEAMYFVIYTLCTVGYGDVLLSGALEKWYACLVLCGTILTNGYIVGKLVSIMQSADIDHDRTGKQLETLAFLRSFAVPQQLQDEVLQFQDHLLSHSLTDSYAQIVEGLPNEMQKNILLFVRLKLVSSVPHFSDAHYIVKVAIAEILGNCVLLPEQYVIVVGDTVTAMQFIAHGFVDVFGAGGIRTASLSSGEYFGESAIFETTRSQLSIKALTYCDTWELRRSSFVEVLDRFPKFRRIIESKKAAYLAQFAPNPATDASETEQQSNSPVHPTISSLGAFRAFGNSIRSTSIAADEPTVCNPAIVRAQARHSIVPTKLTFEQKLTNIFERLHACLEKAKAL